MRFNNKTPENEMCNKSLWIHKEENITSSSN